MNAFKRTALLLAALLPLAICIPAHATDPNVWPWPHNIRKVHFEPDTIRFGQAFSLQVRDPEISNCDVIYAANLYFEDIDGHFEIQVYRNLWSKKLVPGCKADPEPFGPALTGVTAKKDRYDGVVRWGSDTTWPGNYTTFGTILKNSTGGVVTESYRTDYRLITGGTYPVRYSNFGQDWAKLNCPKCTCDTCGYVMEADSITVLPALSKINTTGINLIAQNAIALTGMAAAYTGGHLSLRMPSGGSWSGDLMTAAGERITGIRFAGERFELSRKLGPGVYVISLKGNSGSLRARVVATETP